MIAFKQGFSESFAFIAKKGFAFIVKKLMFIEKDLHFRGEIGYH